MLEDKVTRMSIYCAAAALLLLISGGCSSAYYRTLEGLGIEKRDILVDRVEDARDAQDSPANSLPRLWTSFAARLISTVATWKMSMTV